MSRSALHASSVGAAKGPKPAVKRTNKQKVGAATAKNEIADGSAATAKNALQTKVPRNLSVASSQLRPPNSVENAQPQSRMELLLAHHKAPQLVYRPPEETQLSKRVNKAIKLTSQWADVQRVVEEAPELSASNVGFALYRLGCLNSFASSYRKAEMRNSELVQRLLAEAQQKLHQMDAGSVTLVLDGAARLEIQPEGRLLASLANSVHSFAPVLEASQLPLVLWAFDRLHFVPRASVLAALDGATDRLAAALSPQGIALALRGFQAARFLPSQRTLNRLAEAMQRKLASFKPSELSASFTAFSAFNFTPQPQLVMAVAEQGGQSLHSNIVTGKPSLSRSASLKLEETAVLPERQNLIETSSKAAASQLAAAGRMLRSVSQKMSDSEAMSMQNSKLSNATFKAPAAL